MQKFDTIRYEGSMSSYTTFAMVQGIVQECHVIEFGGENDRQVEIPEGYFRVNEVGKYAGFKLIKPL